MKHPSRRLFAPVLALCALALVAASAPVPQDAELSLHDLMMGIKRDFKTLHQSAGDPNMADKALDALQGLQQYTMVAKLTEPPNLGDIDRDERDAHKKAYRADMARLLEGLAQTEIAVLEGRTEAAQALVGALVDLRNASHDKYQDEE